MPDGEGQHAIILLRAVEFQLLDQTRGYGSPLHPPQRLCSRRWYPGGDGGGQFRWRWCGVNMPEWTLLHPGGDPHQMFIMVLTILRCNCRSTFSVLILVLAYHPGLESLGLTTQQNPAQSSPEFRVDPVTYIHFPHRHKITKIKKILIK